MAKTGYVKTALTGGGASALDGISGAVLLAGDFAFVGVNNLAYFYIYSSSTAVESSPDIIVPDTADSGNLRWLLQNLTSDGFTSVSTTSLAVAVGSKTLTVETNKGFVVGMSVKIAYTTTPTTWMHGDVTAYNPATGSLTVNVTTISGSGTQTAWTVSMSAPAYNMTFKRGGTLLNSIDGLTAVNVFVGVLPFACTVTAVKGWRVGGTGATINARLNGASNHLASALSLTSASTVMDGGAVQNTAYVAGDYLEIMLVSVAGTVTQIGIEVTFERA